MNDFFSTKKQKILLSVNVIIISLYFIFDITSIALFVTPEFNVLWKFVSIIFPWIIIYFTAPRTDGGSKITVSLWGVILFFFYQYNGNIQIKGNAYRHQLTGAALLTTEIRTNMIFAVALSCLIIVSGCGIFYRIKEKRNAAAIETITDEEAPIEYIYYDKEGNISKEPTTHRVKKFD